MFLGTSGDLAIVGPLSLRKSERSTYCDEVRSPRLAEGSPIFVCYISRDNPYRSGRVNRFDTDRVRVGEIMTLKVEGHIDQSDHHGHFRQGSDDGRECGPELIPNTETATAMASSKLLEAAVNESVVVLE